MALPEPQTPSGESKERLISEQEKIPVVEKKEGEISPEVKDYITKVETAAEITLPQPVTDDSGQVILDTAAPQQVTVTLPMTEEEIKRGLRYKIVDSVRWLAEWCQRLLKLTKSKFTYRHAT